MRLGGMARQLPLDWCLGTASRLACLKIEPRGVVETNETPALNNKGSLSWAVLWTGLRRGVRQVFGWRCGCWKLDPLPLVDGLWPANKLVMMILSLLRRHASNTIAT